MSLDLYAEEILDHYKNPRNSGRIEKPDLYAKENNPLCGDEIELYVKFRNGKVADVKFTAEGCAISQASASMFTEQIKGMERQELERMQADFVDGYIGIQLSPSRLKCALMPYSALKLGLKQKQ